MLGVASTLHDAPGRRAVRINTEAIDARLRRPPSYRMNASTFTARDVQPGRMWQQRVGTAAMVARRRASRCSTRSNAPATGSVVGVNPDRGEKLVLWPAPVMPRTRGGAAAPAVSGWAPSLRGRGRGGAGCAVRTARSFSILIGRRHQCRISGPQWLWTLPGYRANMMPAMPQGALPAEKPTLEHEATLGSWSASPVIIWITGKCNGRRRGFW